jgi:hypothetical protein
VHVSAHVLASNVVGVSGCVRVRVSACLCVRVCMCCQCDCGSSHSLDDRARAHALAHLSACGCAREGAPFWAGRADEWVYVRHVPVHTNGVRRFAHVRACVLGVGVHEIYRCVR